MVLTDCKGKLFSADSQMFLLLFLFLFRLGPILAGKNIVLVMESGVPRRARPDDFRFSAYIAIFSFISLLVRTRRSIGRAMKLTTTPVA